MKENELRIVYYGTPDFAVPGLEILLQNGLNVVAVVTAPDKPAGRGLKIQQTPVKLNALAHGIPVLQPLSLKDPLFLAELSSFSPDIQIVVAFRKMPEAVWQLPAYGTFNLHASLLPKYRGAAPINWAIINGETETGITTFFINEHIDTGKVILQERIPIAPADDAGILHDRLMLAGAELLLKTVRLIASENLILTDQAALLPGEVVPAAPKLNKDNCRINWQKSAREIHNFTRGLSPYPAAHAELVCEEGPVGMKIFKTDIQTEGDALAPGQIRSDGRKFLQVGTADGIIDLLEIQAAGRKKMSIGEFLRGFRLGENTFFKV
jgi:methionyl-tRNA formyltransferase